MPLLPEHLHFILRLPEYETDYSIRIASIKAQFTKAYLTAKQGNGFGSGRRSRGERTVWQHRFWEHMIRNEDDFRRHVEYIHFNPVKHELVDRAQDWPYSSFHRYVRKGVYPLDWGGCKADFNNGRFGE